MAVVVNLLISHTDLDGYSSQLMNLLRINPLTKEPIKLIENLYNNKDNDNNIDSLGIEQNSTIKNGLLEYVVFYNFNYDNVDEGIREIFVKNNDKEPNTIYNVYITDINLSMDTAYFLNELKIQGAINHLELLDHHITGKEVSEKYPEWYHMTIGISATSLAFNKLFPIPIDNIYYNVIKELTSIINAADVFDTEDNKVFEAGRCLNNILEYIFKSVKNKSHARFLVWCYLIILINTKSTTLVEDILNKEDDRGRERIKMLFNLLNNLIDGNPYNSELVKLGKHIETPLHVLYYNNQVQSILSLGSTITLKKENESIKYLLVSGYNQSLSDVAYYTLYNRKDLDFIVFKLDNKMLSFRSFETVGEDGNKCVRYDVSELAKKLGGGGHRVAAGCILSKNSTEEEIKQLIKDNL